MNFETFDIESIKNSGKIRDPETRNELKKLLKSLIKEGEQIVNQSTENLPNKANPRANPSAKPTKRLICPECEKYFFSFENLTKHMVKEHETDFIEENLEEPKPSTSTASTTVQVVKNEEDCIEYVPEIKIKLITLQKPINKKITEKLIIEPIDENTCDICLKKLTSKKSLALHKTLMHSKSKTQNRYSFQCTKCPKRFRKEDILMTHNYKEHGGKRVYNLCKICGKDLSTKYRLAHHIKTTHEKSISQVCPICGKTLYMAGSIQKHIDLHSDVRPYQCDECDSAFKQKHDYTVHKRLHSGERPYECRFCDTSFIANTNLHKHMKSAHKDLL